MLEPESSSPPPQLPQPPQPPQHPTTLLSDNLVVIYQIVDELHRLEAILNNEEFAAGVEQLETASYHLYLVMLKMVARESLARLRIGLAPTNKGLGNGSSQQQLLAQVVESLIELEKHAEAESIKARSPAPTTEINLRTPPADPDSVAIEPNESVAFKVSGL